MTIHLSEDRERRIRSLMRGGGFASEAEVIDEGLRLIEERQQELGAQTAATDRTHRQRENLKQLCEKLDALPTTAIADGLSNRDHDLILYGRQP